LSKRTVVVAVVVVLLYGFWQPGMFWLPVLSPGAVFLDAMRLLPARISSTLAYSMDPEGGPVAALGVIVLGAAIFWTAVLGFWIWRRLRARTRTH
jgi:hypothetical protein